MICHSYDSLRFSKTSTEGVIYKGKTSTSAIMGLVSFSLGVGGKQKESLQLSQ